MRRLLLSRKGDVFAWAAALMLLVGLPLTSLSIDVVRMMYVRGHLQTATDAACQSAADALDVQTFIGSGDPCNSNPLSNVKGGHTDLLIQNRFSQRINLYFYLRETAQGCGYGNVYLDSKEATTISIPVGCYDFFGWFSESGSVDGYACFKKSGTNSAIIGGGLIDFSY